MSKALNTLSNTVVFEYTINPRKEYFIFFFAYQSSLATATMQCTQRRHILRDRPIRHDCLPRPGCWNLEKKWSEIDTVGKKNILY